MTICLGCASWTGSSHSSAVQVRNSRDRQTASSSYEHQGWASYREEAQRRRRLGRARIGSSCALGTGSSMSSSLPWISVMESSSLLSLTICDGGTHNTTQNKHLILHNLRHPRRQSMHSSLSSLARQAFHGRAYPRTLIRTHACTQTMMKPLLESRSFLSGPWEDS